MDFPLKKNIVYERIKNKILSGILSPSQKLPSEYDLAKEYGVSYITMRASLALLEKDGLVLRVHGRGTFITSHQQQESGKPMLIVLADTANDISFPCHYIIPGIVASARESGIDTEICSSDSFSGKDIGTIRKRIKALNVPGIILLASNFLGHEPILSVLKELALPTVLAHGLAQDHRVTGLAVISYDERAAWKMALQHLIDQGFNRIATIAKKLPYNMIRGYSLQEYPNLLKSLGADSSPELLKLSEFSSKNIRNSVKELLSLPHPPEAIMCFSDFFAIHVYEALEELGLKIPENVAVMGFCGAPDGEYLSPTLSTINLGFLNIGDLAVKTIANSKEWFPAGKAPLILSPFELVKRDSTDSIKCTDNVINQ